MKIFGIGTDIVNINRMEKSLKKNKIRISLFIEPLLSNVELAFMLGVDCVELHTGTFCNFFISISMVVS